MTGCHVACLLVLLYFWFSVRVVVVSLETTTSQFGLSWQMEHAYGLYSSAENGSFWRAASNVCKSEDFMEKGFLTGRSRGLLVSICRGLGCGFFPKGTNDQGNQLMSNMTCQQSSRYAEWLSEEGTSITLCEIGRQGEEKRSKPVLRRASTQAAAEDSPIPRMIFPWPFQPSKKRNMAMAPVWNGCNQCVE